jgi:predicted nucleic acid-binding Zn ribbon protein
MAGVDSISHLIENYIADKKLGSKLKSSKIFNYWEEIVGAEISRNSRPKKLKDKILYISTINPIWAGELSLMSQDIICKINGYLKEDAVSSLRIKSDLLADQISSD